MARFEVDGVTYRFRKLCAAEQFALLNRVMPLLPTLTGMEFGLRLPGVALKDVAGFLAPLASIGDDEADAVFSACLGACERLDGEAWRPVEPTLRVADLVSLAVAVVMENFGALFSMRRPEFRPVMVEGAGYEPARMPDGEDWLFRPVLRGLCKAESLHDGTLRIEQIAKLNDALDVSDENEARARKAAERK